MTTPTCGLVVRPAQAGDDLTRAGRIVHDAYLDLPGYPVDPAYDESLRDAQGRAVQGQVVLALLDELVALAGQLLLQPLLLGPALEQLGLAGGEGLLHHLALGGDVVDGTCRAVRHDGVGKSVDTVEIDAPVLGHRQRHRSDRGHVRRDGQSRPRDTEQGVAVGGGGVRQPVRRGFAQGQPHDGDDRGTLDVHRRQPHGPVRTTRHADP